MSMLTHRKTELIERGQRYYHTHIYVPDQKKYIQGFLHEPGGIASYRQTEWEPTVETAGLYDLNGEEAWVSVNCYNALVLNSRNLLIADIDFGDPRLSQYAGVQDCDEVVANLKDLAVFDDEHTRQEDFSFQAQSYHVYQTHSGCRVICTSICLPWCKLGWLAARFMRFLGGDPDYISMCRAQKCYRARLTPKPWRVADEPSHACDLYGVIGDGKVHPDLAQQLALHDEITGDETRSEWSCLA